jgi:DNA-binding transcriptional LysR family regulator
VGVATVSRAGARHVVGTGAGVVHFAIGIRQQFDAACTTAGITPRIAFEAGTPLALADLAERGLGVAIVPASVPRGRDGLHALAIVPELRGRLVLAWRSGGPMSPAARVLVEKARRLLRVGAGA